MRQLTLTLILLFRAVTALDPVLFKDHPFDYDLHPTIFPGNETIMVCLHGLSGDYQHAEKIQSCGVEETLVSFNFPDYGDKRDKLPAFGTITELLPALYILKTCVVDGKVEKMNLYGYSVGGGALVNLIGTLKTSAHDDHLNKIGITQKEKDQILQAIEKGKIILDTPLKSVEEVIDRWGSSFELFYIAQQYKFNNFRPIDGLHHLDGFNILIHFQKPDQILSNRDDDLYIEKIKKANIRGTTEVVVGSDENGHSIPHPTLWKHYTKEKS